MYVSKNKHSHYHRILANYNLFISFILWIMLYGDGVWCNLRIIRSATLCRVKYFYEKTHLRDITVDTYAQQRNANKV